MRSGLLYAVSFVSESSTLGVTVNGQSVTIPTGDAALSAIDTGTTLIGGPTDGVQAIYQAIPNSQALAGQMEGFFAFRACQVNLVAFS